MSGMITEITTSFPEGGTPELPIAGYDHGFPLTIGKNSRTLDEGARQRRRRTRSRASTTSTRDIETTKEQHAQIEQNQESDFEFLKKLADRNHFELYVDEQTHAAFRQAATTRRRPSCGCVWGEGLLSFKPEANLAGQVAKVEVYGWDPKTKEGDRRHRARAGEESGLDAGQERRPAAARPSSRDPNKQPVLRLRQPVFTQAEAKQRAKAALNERAKQFLTGEAESDRPARDPARPQRRSSTTSASRSRRPTTSSRPPTRSTATAIARDSR